MALPAVREYRCKKCKKVLGEARAVLEMTKLCPRCGKMNTFDDSEELRRIFSNHAA